ncbi:MAG: outer membrane beta-barrel protein [Lacibacter sp.]
MHNNEFEKRVEHKLEELKFTPSDAVWQKVEVQIREKKRRRRFFFWWMPAIVLCTGIAGWFIYSLETGNEQTKNSTVITEKKTEPASTVKNNTSEQGVQESKPEEKKEQPVVEKSIQKEEEPIVAVKKQMKENVADQLKIKENQKVSANEKDQFIVKEEKPVGAEIKNPDAVNHIEVNVPLPEVKKEPEVAEVKQKEQIEINKNVISEKPVLTGNPVVTEEPVVSGKPVTAEESVVADSSAGTPVNEPVVVAKPVISKKKKLEVALIFRGGVADMSQFTEGSNKSDRLYATPGSVGSGGYSPSPSDSAKVKNGAGITAGVQLKKSIAKRSALSIGLAYGYYSSSHKTSGIVYADAQFSNSLGTSVVNNYARVGNSATYKDRYHFIEIPVLYHLQVNKTAKRPILFNGGIAYSYLAGSNAQYYYSATKTYYYDRSLFSRSQLQLRTGISFGLVKKMNYPLQLGLQYQYGLSGQWKKSLDLNQHLSFTGIQLSWRLNKK